MTLHIVSHYAQALDGSFWLADRQDPVLVAKKWEASDRDGPLKVECSATLETLMDATGYDDRNESRHFNQKYTYSLPENRTERKEGYNLVEFAHKGTKLSPGQPLSEFEVRDGAVIDVYLAGSFSDQSINEH